MIKTFWNEDDYNTLTDGRVKNVNGSGMFIPYMHGLDDPIYKNYIKELLKLDWLHHKLYIVGGILEGWPTTDIDICVTGKAVEQTRDLMLAARAMGPLDMYWVKTYDKIFKGKDNGIKVWKFAKAHDRWSTNGKQWNGEWKKDGLFHMSGLFTVKENKKYTKDALLIN
tara:strand:+ start:233 stop:736 length:504 start_codon:yes stop_codon:yes gene_type:complete